MSTTITPQISEPMQDLLNENQEAMLKRTRDVLGRLRDILAETNAGTDDRTALADSIRQLDELFLLVVAGEFNSGKSSFINALIGSPLLAEGVTPTTSQIYLLKYGTTAEQKPIEKGVWQQTAPVEFLKRINIVDTPGTNAIVREHEALTAEFIPRSDLVLFITSADRPFTESERNFLTQIRDWGKKIVLVVNKKDILNSPEDEKKVLEFVTHGARDLLGTLPAIYAVSAKQAQRAKSGDPDLWEDSQFAPLENYIHDTLDDQGRFQLKLLNPLGVGQKLVQKQLTTINTDLETLQSDTKLLEDIQGQMTYYNSDMRRSFEGRLGEINNLLYEMEKRGNQFFDEYMRVTRMPDLLRKERVKMDFEEQVVADTPEQIEKRVGELIDWLVEQDLRQWSAVADHLSKRVDEHSQRIVGEGGFKEGTLAYDRQRLVDSIAVSTRQAIASYDKRVESAHLAEAARSAVVQTGVGLGAVGLGTAIALGTTAAFLDVTGVLIGLVGAAMGLLILPARKRKAKQELAEKLAELRQRLVASLTEQFDREMRRSAQRIEDTIAPFARFVRSENDKISKQREGIEEIEAHIMGLKAQLGS